MIHLQVQQLIVQIIKVEFQYYCRIRFDLITKIDILVTDVTYVVRKHYENFETIDWLKDLMRNRIRHRTLRSQRRDGWKKRFIFWFDAWSGWICVLLVGVSAG